LSSQQFEYDLSQTDLAAAFVLQHCKHPIVAISGQMGAGKTTLIKSICQKLGVVKEVSSPTFSLVNEYNTADNKLIYHFDFYRIRSIEEVYDIGYEDYFYSGNLCMIEWPEMIEELLHPNETTSITISVLANGNRMVSVSG
jgi:tRNA threonylcarbamoyladenosine biosynthesis protein TsaE